jgi:hypothetical protein
MPRPNSIYRRRRATSEMLRIAAARRRRAQRRRAIAADLALDFHRQRARHLDIEKRRNAHTLRPEVRDERLANDDVSRPAVAAGASSPRNFEVAGRSAD